VDSSRVAAFLAPLRKAEWVVYAKKPFAGPQAVQSAGCGDDNSGADPPSHLWFSSLQSARSAGPPTIRISYNMSRSIGIAPGRRSNAPTVIGARCAQILLPGKGKRLTIAPHAEHLGNVG
jgi:hypothetical protein